MRKIVPYETAWYKFFDLCYYTLSVKFIERFDFVKKWREEAEEVDGDKVSGNKN
jgi:hypothetical protein